MELVLIDLFFSPGEALHKHLHRIIPALIGSLQGIDEEDRETWQAAEGRTMTHAHTAVIVTGHLKWFTVSDTCREDTTVHCPKLDDS